MGQHDAATEPLAELAGKPVIGAPSMAYGRSGGPCPDRGSRDSGARPRSGCAVSLYAVGNLPAQPTDVRGNDRSGLYRIRPAAPGLQRSAGPSLDAG